MFRCLGVQVFHTTAREPKRAHLSAPALKNTTKIPQRRHPREREKKKERHGGGRGRKKSEILGGPHLDKPDLANLV